MSFRRGFSRIFRRPFKSSSLGFFLLNMKNSRNDFFYKFFRGVFCVPFDFLEVFLRAIGVNFFTNFTTTTKNILEGVFRSFKKIKVL